MASNNQENLLFTMSVLEGALERLIEKEAYNETIETIKSYLTKIRGYHSEFADLLKDNELLLLSVRKQSNEIKELQIQVEVGNQ